MSIVGRPIITSTGWQLLTAQHGSVHGLSLCLMVLEPRRAVLCQLVLTNARHLAGHAWCCYEKHSCNATELWYTCTSLFVRRQELWLLVCADQCPACPACRALVPALSMDGLWLHWCRL